MTKHKIKLNSFYFIRTIFIRTLRLRFAPKFKKTYGLKLEHPQAQPNCRRSHKKKSVQRIGPSHWRASLNYQPCQVWELLHEKSLNSKFLNILFGCQTIYIVWLSGGLQRVPGCEFCSSIMHQCASCIMFAHFHYSSREIAYMFLPMHLQNRGQRNFLNVLFYARWLFTYAFLIKVIIRFA